MDFPLARGRQQYLIASLRPVETACQVSDGRARHRVTMLQSNCGDFVWSHTDKWLESDRQPFPVWQCVISARSHKRTRTSDVFLAAVQFMD